MAKSEYRRGYNQGVEDIIFKLLWSFFGYRDIKRVLAKIERLQLKSKKVARLKQTKPLAKSAAAGGK
jgi:hypothetical protein